MELGIIDIQLEVTLMSQYQMNLREVNLEALYLIFHFLIVRDLATLAARPYLLKRPTRMSIACCI